MTSLKPQVDNELKMKENAFKKDIKYSKEFDMEQRMEKTRSKVALASEELENAMKP